jgi:hypothetical protein
MCGCLSSESAPPSAGSDAGQPCDGSVQPCPSPCQPITKIELVSVQFTSDHDLLKKYDADWKDGGSRYPKPEWTSATHHPVSHTMDQQVEIKIVVEVQPANACPETGKIRGEAPDGLVFEQASWTFSAGKQTIVLKSDKKLPKKVNAMEFRIKWSTTGTSVPISPAETANKMYITYDTPYNDTPFGNEVTEKRLAWVCGLCAGDSNGHDSVKKIHDSTGTYDLSSSTPSPHWNIAGGAHAQCMDLSKFYWLATELLGLRAGIVVYLFPRIGKATTESTNPSDVQRRSVAATHPASTPHKALNPNEEILLVDFSGGWNNFEACFKFTHPDSSGTAKTRYYAGGAGIYDTKEAVMKAVCQRTEWTWEGSPGGWSICTSPGPSPAEKWS